MNAYSFGFVASAAALAAVLSLGSPARGETFFYQDDFDGYGTELDAWSHTPVVEELPEFSTGPMLQYVQVLPIYNYSLEPWRRELAFYTGLTLYLPAEIAYEAAPSGAVSTGGYVQMFAWVSRLNILRSADGIHWRPLGQLLAGVAGETVSLPIPAGLPISYLRIENDTFTAVIDNLELSLTYMPDAVPGDANLDGVVNVSDLGILGNHYGQTTTAGWLDGDFNDDGVVNVGDLGLLGAHYGQGSGGGQAVPEPTVLWLLCLGGLLRLGRARR